MLEKARTKIIEMRKAVMPGPDGKSSIEAQADTAAKAGDAVELEKLVDDSQETLEADANETDDALSTVEAWLGQAEIVAANAPAAKPTPHAIAGCYARDMRIPTQPKVILRSCRAYDAERSARSSARGSTSSASSRSGARWSSRTSSPPGSCSRTRTRGPSSARACCARCATSAATR